MFVEIGAFEILSGLHTLRSLKMGMQNRYNGLLKKYLI